MAVPILSLSTWVTTYDINFMYQVLPHDVNDFEQDNDDVCTICKNMVTEARDTLRANETQEELKEVFEGSCALIPIKVAF